MVDPTNRRRFLVASGVTAVGLSGCLGSSDDESTENGNENGDENGDENGNADGDGNPDRTLEWDGQGDEHATQDCPDQAGYWKWVLTPGGPDPIVVDDDEPVLTVEFDEGDDETEIGYHPGGGGGAVHFDVTRSGGGTVTEATVEFSGGGDNPMLTISEGECIDDEDEPPEPDVPVVVTEPATDVNESTATLNGYLSDLGDYDAVDVSFQYRVAGADEWAQTESATLSEYGEFSHEISDLETGSEYEFRAIATAGENGVRVEGSILGFTKEEEDPDPDPEDPDVDTEPATDVNESTAVLNGVLTDLGDYDAVDVSFQYRVAGADEWAQTESETLSEPGEFSREISGLVTGTDYEFRAVAVANDTTVYGDTLTFTKDDPDEPDEKEKKKEDAKKKSE